MQKGRIKIVVESEQGEEAVVAMLGQGEFFGKGCLIGQPLRLATAKAMVESEIMRVSKAEIVCVLQAEPAFLWNHDLLCAECSSYRLTPPRCARSPRGRMPR